MAHDARGELISCCVFMCCLDWTHLVKYGYRCNTSTWFYLRWWWDRRWAYYRTKQTAGNSKYLSLLHIDKLCKLINIDFKWFFGDIAAKEWIATKWMEILLFANRNCHRLSRVSWALALISCNPGLTIGESAPYKICGPKTCSIWCNFWRLQTLTTVIFGTCGAI